MFPKHLVLARSPYSKPVVHNIVFVWSEEKGRQQHKGPFGPRIKIMWEEQLVDPPVDFNPTEGTLMLKIKLYQLQSLPTLTPKLNFCHSIYFDSSWLQLNFTAQI